MTGNEFRAALRAKAAAIFLGAAVAGAGLAISMPADAAVRPAVGKPLQEAQSLAASGNYTAAMSKVREAESVGGLSSEESRDVAQMKSYVESRQNSTSGAGKLGADYRAGRWSAVIQDAESMRGLGPNDMAAVATAYYKLHEDSQCLNYIDSHFGNGGGAVVLEIKRACAYEAGNDKAQTEALEQLVAITGKPEYWGELLSSAERSKALKDPQMLDIYRLRLRTGTMEGAKDYMLLSKLALAGGLPSEAVAVEQKGIDAKALSGDTVTRLVAMSKTQQAQDASGWAAKLAAAQKSPSGDALIKLGEDLIGQGKAKDAIPLIQQGIAKDKTDLGNAYRTLGLAYLDSGEKDQAVRAFGKVKGNGTPNQELLARIWALYARK